MNTAKITLLFWIAAAYDGIIGMAFLLVPIQIFAWYQVTPPNHLGYVRFPAALLLVFALMFAAIALNPADNRGLIPYGILLKVSYCAVTFGYWLTEGVPEMWKPFAVADLVFAVLFVAAYRQLSRLAVSAE